MAERMRRLRLACPFCDYDMQGAVSPKCPECGKYIVERDYQLLKGKQTLPRSRWLIACIVGGCCLAAESPVAMFYLAALFERFARGLFRLPCGTAPFAIILGFIASVRLTFWIAYRPLRVLSLPASVKIAMSALLFSAIGVAISFCVYGLALFIKYA